LPHRAGQAQNSYVRLVALFLLIGVSAVSQGLSSFEETPFHHRDPVPKDPYSEELVKKAEAGDAVAQWNLGMCYSGGWKTSEGFIECKEVKKNPEEAIKWLRKSAEQGNPEAQLEMYGYYVEMANEEERTRKVGSSKMQIYENLKIAEEWILKAAEGGNTAAQMHAAHKYFYSNSKGAERIEDLNEAKKFYVKLAEKGDQYAKRAAENCDIAIQKIQRQLKTTKSK
jgi:TPR repeat protein